VAFPGLSINGFSVASDSGIVFFTLKPFEERRSASLSGPAIAGALNQKFSGIQDAFVLTVMPPAVMGLGTFGGFKLYIEDRAGLGYDAMYQSIQSVTAAGYQTPALGGLFSTYTVNTPQLDADVDREKAKTEGVPLGNLFDTLQIYLGSLYVNDFNDFGRTYEVIAQADSQFREHAADIARLKTRNDRGQMVPLGTLVKVTETHGPDRVMRYNGYPAAEINGGPAPGYSSGQAEAAMAKIAAANLPRGMSYEWTDLTFQRILAGNTTIYVGPLCILLVFLVLAALYESFRLPLAIILIVPMCLLFAITGVWLKGRDNNIFTQIGFIVLVGLACKNAILIVEFAKRKQDEGLSPFAAAIEACRLRLRPILMTSIAFIAGVFPLVVSHGAGAEMRQAMGIAVFSGMIGVTLFGLFLTPVFYVTLMKLGAKKKPAHESNPVGLGPAGAAAGIALFLSLAFAPSAHANWLEVGPDYQPLTNSLPASYKATPMGAWKEGRPLDDLPKGTWWEIFGDTNLNALEAQAFQANQELQGTFARLEQSRDTARVARGQLLPQANFDPSFNRERYSPNEQPSFGPLTANTFNTPLDLSYEVDLWGRVRRSFESSRADAQASLADYYNVLLTLQSDVAQNYFALRELDQEIAIVTGTINLRNEQVRFVHSRYEGGIGSELEIAQAETELATTEADAASLAKRRDELENAIAILVGRNPSDFHVAQNTNEWAPESPKIPAGLPGDLLERRPDIAQAERQLASANAKIGVAKAAFFPVVTLTGSAGYASADVSSLFNWESRTWTFGPSVSLPIFAGGRNRANYHRSKAAYNEAVAAYRQQVLVAFGDVENSLGDIQHLAEQASAQDRAVTSARRSADLAAERYRSGIVSYIEVVDANRDALTAERAATQLTGERLTATVQLIKALGGGFDAGLLQAHQAARKRL
jgi:NodT family efflux transporter outer membrane factor (OMF) lipoprotein